MDLSLAFNSSLSQVSSLRVTNKIKTAINFATTKINLGLTKSICQLSKNPSNFDTKLQRRNWLSWQLISRRKEVAQLEFLCCSALCRGVALISVMILVLIAGVMMVCQVVFNLRSNVILMPCWWGNWKMTRCGLIICLVFTGSLWLLIIKLSTRARPACPQSWECSGRTEGWVRLLCRMEIGVI